MAAILEMPHYVAYLKNIAYYFISLTPHTKIEQQVCFFSLF